MRIFLVLSIIFATLLVTNASLFNPYPKLKTHYGDTEALKDEEPLFITPLLEAHKDIENIQKMAFVDLQELKEFPSYSGFFTVDKKYDSNLFFWYFPAKIDPENSPVVLWLQGGPGGSSLFGLLTENGPISVSPKSGKVTPRKYSWHFNHHLIYIDNPVGTGFSFTNSSDGYSTNEEQVGTNLYEGLKQFFTLFPKLQKNEFYVTGESYAGKYVPAVSHAIHRNNGNSKVKINLQGLFIGDGLCDPYHQLAYGDYLYQLGLIDSNGLKTFHEYEKKGKDFIIAQDFESAFRVFDELLDADQFEYGSVFKNLTGFVNYYNYIKGDSGDGLDDDIAKFLNRTDVRKSIHVGNLKFNGLDGVNLVEQHLQKDIMNSVVPYITELLNSYRVVFYNGQLDIIVAYPLTIRFIQKLSFNGSEEYKTSPRTIWRVDNKIAGYVRHGGNLVEVLVRNAGHMVPSDQPKWALDLLMHLTHKKKFI